MKRAALAALALIAGTLMPSPARAAPLIAFLNPSGYSTTLQMSDAPDSDSAYHLVAWVQQVPPNPLVEFELASTGQNPQTITASRVGNSDTWDAFFQIPTTDTDGAYTLRARLYSGTSEVSNDQKTVTIKQMPPTAAQTVEIQYPANGGSLGFFTPKGKATNAVIVTQASAGTQQVRILYSESDPGNAPTWQQCGAGTPNSTTHVARVLCTLKSGDVPAGISAIAAVANGTPPPADPNPNLDETGDAHRVVPYLQQPTRINISPQAASNDPNKCTQAAPFPLVATMLDQLGQPVAQANIDLHAVGPNDQLRFGTIRDAQGNSITSAFQPPDKNHISSEFAVNCADGSNLGTQGEHNVPGGSDTKHIESTGPGTNNAGQFTFALRADSVGPTAITAWADVDDDDLLGSGEASGGARIGWGQAPPPPVDQLSITPSTATPSAGSCQKVTINLTEDASPLAARNVDVHAIGPDASLAFCDAGTGLPRTPDQGGHVGYTHSDGTLHGEGETDSTGHFVFGLTASAVGNTAITAWMDKSDDDIQGTDEPSSQAQLNWQPAGRRSISLRSNKSSVFKGSKVKLSGTLSGSDACVANQVVSLKARRQGSRRFRNAGSATTDADGDYGLSTRVRKTTDYRALVSAAGACSKARSRIVTVRAS